MARIQLEFAPRQRWRWLPWILVCAALAIIGGAINDRYLHARAELRTVVETNEKFEKQRRESLKMRVTDPLTVAELSSAHAAIRRLSFPWEQFFAAIEAAQNDNVVLLELRPDVEKSTVTIFGESKDFNAIARYVQQLQTQDQFTDVYLIEHSVQIQDAGKPVRFQIGARWHQRVKSP